MARSAGLLWPTNHLLQPFRPVAKGRSMGSAPSDTPSERAKSETQELEKARSEAQRGNSDTKGDKQNAAQTDAVEAEHPGWYSENRPYRPCPAVAAINGRNVCLGCPRTMSISSIVSAGEQVVRFDGGSPPGRPVSLTLAVTISLTLAGHCDGTNDGQRVVRRDNLRRSADELRPTLPKPKRRFASSVRSSCDLPEWHALCRLTGWYQRRHA
jgi:hypothetical protein